MSVVNTYQLCQGWANYGPHAARGHLQKYKPCSLVLTVEMAWAAIRDPLTSRYQFLKSLSTFIFLLNAVEFS